MKKLSFIGLLLMLASCTKRDFHTYQQYFNYSSQECAVASLNGDNQIGNDFFVVKTFDNARRLVHLRTQLRDLYENTYLYDYRITYSPGRATFVGTTTQRMWLFDDENNTDPEHFDPPVTMWMSEVINTRSFEVLFDRHNGYVSEVRYVDDGEPLIRLSYDNANHLSRVITYYKEEGSPAMPMTTFKVATGESGNILSLKDSAMEGTRFGPNGIVYQYNPGSAGKKFYYEPNTWFIHPMYALLEVLDWGPFQPHSERTSSYIKHADPPWDIDIDVFVTMNYHSHRYDAGGNLEGYEFEGEFGAWWGGVKHNGRRSRQVGWNCRNTSSIATRQ